jgi:hypothetical protein
LAPCGQKKLISLLAKLINLADDFTGMLETFLDVPQQFFLFVVRHIHLPKRRFPMHRQTHDSNWEEVTASTKRMQSCE